MVIFLSTILFDAYVEKEASEIVYYLQLLSIVFSACSVSNNVVADYDLLNELLTEDTFENITKCDGVSRQYKVSQEYENKVSTLLEDLNGDDRDIEWYIDEEHLVIVEEEIGKKSLGNLNVESQQCQ